MLFPPYERLQASVTPIPKGTTSSDPANYRPTYISAFSVKQLSSLKYISETFYLITSVGVTLSVIFSGASPKENQWLEHILLPQAQRPVAPNTWWRPWDLHGHSTKAFDSVPHRVLLAKLQSVNVHPHILKWICSYLCGRTQYVCVGGATSVLQPVISGVPQGSAHCYLISRYLLWQALCLCMQTTWCYTTSFIHK